MLTAPALPCWQLSTRTAAHVSWLAVGAALVCAAAFLFALLRTRYSALA